MGATGDRNRVRDGFGMTDLLLALTHRLSGGDCLRSRWQIGLRRDDRTLARALHADGIIPLRVVSNILSTKGKAETWLCGARPHEGTLKVMELERKAKRAKHPTFETLARGDLVGVADETLPTEAGKTVRLTPGGWSRLP